MTEWPKAERDLILIDTAARTTFLRGKFSPGHKLHTGRDVTGLRKWSSCETCHIYHKNAATDELFKRKGEGGRERRFRSIGHICMICSLGTKNTLVALMA